jgi:hypothetical protein
MQCYEIPQQSHHIAKVFNNNNNNNNNNNMPLLCHVVNRFSGLAAHYLPDQSREEAVLIYL